MAMANGGLFGVGLGLGNASVIPAYYNDFIFTVILHEFGYIFGVIVLAIYLLIAVRGFTIASRSSNVFYTLVAVGFTTMIALQTIVIVGGNLKMIPLTGVTLPFISYGGTSMVSSLCMIGFLQGISSRNAAEINEDKLIAGYEAKQ